MKKGYTILSVLGISFLLSAAAITVYHTTNTQTKITHNDRLYKQAKINAQSGITHFVAKRHHYEDLIEIGHGQTEFLLLEGALSPKDHYQVRVRLNENDVFEVTSQGYVLKNEQVLSSASLKATFRSNWISDD